MKVRLAFAVANDLATREDPVRSRRTGPKHEARRVKMSFEPFEGSPGSTRPMRQPQFQPILNQSGTGPAHWADRDERGRRMYALDQLEHRMKLCQDKAFWRSQIGARLPARPTGERKGQ